MHQRFGAFAPSIGTQEASCFGKKAIDRFGCQSSPLPKPFTVFHAQCPIKSCIHTGGKWIGRPLADGQSQQLMNAAGMRGFPAPQGDRRVTAVAPEALKFTSKIRRYVFRPRRLNAYSSPIEKSKEVCRDRQIAIADVDTISLGYQMLLKVAEQRFVRCLLIGHGAPP